MRKAIIPACLIALLLFGGWGTHSRLETNVPADGSITPKAFKRAYDDSIPILDRLTLCPEWMDTSTEYWLAPNAPGKKGRVNLYGYKSSRTGYPPNYGIQIFAGASNPLGTNILGRYINLVLENRRSIGSWTGLNINVSPSHSDSAADLTAIHVSLGAEADDASGLRIISNRNDASVMNIWTEAAMGAWNVYAHGGKSLFKSPGALGTTFVWIAPDSIIMRSTRIAFSVGVNEKVRFRSPAAFDTSLFFSSSYAGYSTLEAGEVADTVWTPAAVKPAGWGPAALGIYTLTPYAATNGGTVSMNGRLYLKAANPGVYFVVASTASEMADIHYMWTIIRRD